mgnify:CR=1 FL=1
MTLETWLKVNIETLAIVLSFSFFGSAMMLWIAAAKAPISVNRAAMAIMGGQVIGSVAALAVFGYLGWSIFLAPMIGVPCGVVALPLLRVVIKFGDRVEDRSASIADSVLNRAVGRQEDKLDRAAGGEEDRKIKAADKEAPR